jgi:hypothetical protein
VRFLSLEAGRYKLATGLKNAGDIIGDVLSVVDFSVNEQCAEYDECSTFAAFVDEGKPVFHVEYPVGNDAATTAVDEKVRIAGCSGQDSRGFSTVLKKTNLDGWVEFCSGRQYETAVADV